MRSLRYLNTVLILIAILLTLHLWTLWNGPIGMAMSPVTTAQAAPRALGIPNAAEQRHEMVDLLKRLNSKTDELIGLFRWGKATVLVKESKTAKADK